MTKPTKHIVIVGGGSAGWLSAGVIAAKLKREYQSGFLVTLVESPNVPIIGVGEGTWPTMRRTLMDMGIDEADFIKNCNVSFKQGAKFAKWVTGKDDDAYYHPLELPIQFEEHNLASAWLQFKVQTDAVPDFATSVGQQAEICQQGLAPKLPHSKPYQGEANYAYHLDAGKFTQFLQKHCVENLNVQHIYADIEVVNSLDNGDIKSVTSQCGKEITGDLFIDCTGFKSLLIGQHYQVPFVSCKETLFVDKALAIQVPYSELNAPIASHTISTAQSAGWIWDIGLTNRRGVGHVFSSEYISEQDAKEELFNYVRSTGGNPEGLSVKSIDITPGHRERFWQNNCVAIGLSAGFLEPLEASALLLVEISAKFIAEQFPVSRNAMNTVGKRFNETFLYRWQSIIDFLKLHYMLTKRTDTPFWRDQNKPSSIPKSLQASLALWQEQPPWHSDFTYAQEVFPAASYQYILYGMGFNAQLPPLGLSANNTELALKHFGENAHLTQKKVNALMSNRSLLNHIYENGITA